MSQSAPTAPPAASQEPTPGQTKSFWKRILFWEKDEPPASQFTWPTKDTLTAELAEAAKVNPLWTRQVVEFMLRVLDKRAEAATHTTSAHWFQRGSAGASAAVATLTGGALLGSVRGRAEVVIGLLAATVGILAAAIAAARPGESYVADLAKKSQYEQLFWNVRAFGQTRLKGIDASDYELAMDQFSQRFATIMKTTPGSVPASS